MLCIWYIWVCFFVSNIMLLHPNVSLPHVSGIGICVCTYVYMYTWMYSAELNAKRVRERYLKAVLHQEISWYDETGAGEIATRIQNDTHLYQQGISEKVAHVVCYMSAFFTGFIYAYARSWRLALTLTSILPGMMLAGGSMNALLSKLTPITLTHVADGGTLAEEAFSNIRSAQAFGSQNILSALFQSHVDKAKKIEIKASIIQGIGVSAMFFVIYAAHALAFSFGTTLINANHGTAGEVVGVFMSILLGSAMMSLIPTEMQAITTGRGAAAKLFATIDRTPDIDSSSTGGLTPEAVEGHISFEHVQFSYPSRPHVPVIGNLSINVRAGQSVALVGASGSGKSTVVSLIERFYDPLSGVVKLDGHNVKDLNLKWLRSHVGLVSQEPVLFAQTVMDNVAHGLINTPYEHAPAEERFRLIKEACIKANAHDFITRLAQGYDTLVGERGLLLSGGQKQRIAIARAIVSNPPVLLLDEATSALDTQSESIVQNALAKASAGRTTITIAHRLSTIKDADVIYVLDNGAIVEFGTHEVLLRKRGGAYTKLAEAQALRETAGQRDPRDLPAEDTADVIQGDADFGTGTVATKGAEVSTGLSVTKRDEEFSLTYIMEHMARLAREQWLQYAIGIIACIVNGAVHPAVGVIYAKGVEGFSSEDPHQRRFLGDRNALWFFILAIIAAIATGLQIYLLGSAAAVLTEKLRTGSFKAVLRQDIEYFDEDDHSTGSLTSRLSSNPQKFNGLAGATLGGIIKSLATVVVGSILGLAFIWKIGLVGTACTPLLIGTGFIRLRVVVMKDQENKAAHEQSAQLACEAAGAIRTVASLTREDQCLAMYRGSLDAPLRRSKRSALWSSLLYALSQSMTFFVTALVFWYGSVLVARQEFTTFQFFAGLMSTVFSAQQAGNVFSHVPDVSSAKSAGSDLIKLLESKANTDAKSLSGKPVKRDRVHGGIRFDNVAFSYPTRPRNQVLHGLSLTIQPGSYIALVGPSGCGKSTLIQLIERFYNPSSGRILLDGEAIDALNVEQYRSQIALVSQEPTLYAGTIRFNILLGATTSPSEVTQEQLEAACRDANILDFIKTLPDGFDTQVGGKGAQLSGGQKQRIAIARALLRNPKVLLLDEATSALDSTSEHVVQAALDQAAQGRTTIAVAHRLSTIQNADCIYFIKEGQIAERGTHDELINKRGHYYAFAQLQAERM
ncbi:hypothetical protein HGRIS_004034 [Hohenbuehelia grisea]|uniref:P-loop containing nucleoside triphosphate hydrolase protein n=1 Tax=Hohenbuehelia grisea TaxID=104357 RepID=A0ABR3JIF5_9AGAR